ncbi:MAG TPA: tetratricopeptide repeat protein [Fimbriiglobus sp.]|jgi:tetratricopeptide (TPR) repeat protein|nr:tetratricopeptide repeat protein [Fimbriiglobus sp.]
MTNAPRLLLLCGAALAVRAGPPPSDAPEHLVRLGNEAYLRGDYAAAEQHYAAAAERTTDPGLVAFNRAAVSVQNGEPREAELYYLRALDDRAAPPDRQAKALYNRGVCLLARGGSTDVYRTAIDCFEKSLDRIPAGDPLSDRAEDNLELAKLLWAKARETDKTRPRPKDLPPEVPEPEPPGAGPDPGPDPSGPSGQPGTRPEAIPGQPSDGAQRETNQKAPGAGNQPVVLDTDRPQPLTPEDTRAILQRLSERLEKDRRANARLLTGPERPDVKDW